MTIWDYTVLLAYLLLVLGIGWLCRRPDGSRKELFLAGRSMGMLPIGISIMVTSFSAINLMAIPEEVSSHGLAVVFSFPVFFLAAWPISRIWIPFFHRRGSMTVYDFLEKRFSCSVRLLASLLFQFWRIGWMAVALYVSGKFLGVFGECAPWQMILLCGAVATFYTMLGGIRAVMWTDLLQFLVLFGGILCALFFALRESPEGIWHLAGINDRLKPFWPADFSFFRVSPFVRMSFWSILLGTMTMFLTRYGADQVVMQRYFTARTEQQARRGIWCNALASFVVLVLLAFLGLVLYAHALGSGASAPGTPLPRGFALQQLRQVSRLFPAGVQGLLVAGLLAATMSSVDSGIHAVTTSQTLDCRVFWSPRRLIFLNGVLVTLLALFLLPYLNRHQSLFAIINRLVNGLGSPLLAIVSLGMFSRKATARGMFWGSLLGVACSFWLTIAVDTLALHYYAVGNFLLTALCCLLFSMWMPESGKGKLPGESGMPENCP